MYPSFSALNESEILILGGKRNKNDIIILDTITDTLTETKQISDFSCICYNNQSQMIRNGLVATLVFTGAIGDYSTQLVTYERGQNTINVIENFGKVD